MQIIHGALNIGHPHVTEQANGRITQSGHDTRPILCAHLGAVFIIDHIANPVEAGLDAPMPANEAPDRGGIGLIRGQIGDAKRHLVAQPQSSEEEQNR